MVKYFVDKDISIAKTIHKDFYLDEKVFEILRTKVFSHAWQYVAHISEIPNQGDILPFEFVESYINEPLILVNDHEGKIHCLSNVCTHRGNLLAYEKCNSAHGIFCKYHGRRFGLDGKFKSMPEFSGVKNFPTEDDNLRSIAIMNYGNLFFAHLTDENVSDPFLPIKQRLSWLPLKDFMYRPEFNKNYFVDCNWALYCENYLEGFHIPFVHEGLNAAIDYGTYETILEDKCILQIGYNDNNQDCFLIPENSIDYGKNIAAYYYWVFPNMMFNFYPWGLSLNIVKPLSINKTKVSFLVFIYDESKYNHGAGSNLDKVEMEDEEVVQNVQRGIQSRFYQHGRYSPIREQGTHHFHWLMSQALEGF